MEIKIDGLEGLKDIIKRYSDIKTKCFVIAKKLCEVGEPVIRETHGSKAKIDIVPEEKGYSLQAEGEKILFIEFGTGDMAGVMNVMYDEVPESVGMGTWSRTHARMYSRYGFWVFGGQILHYTEPQPAFYYAYREMIEALPKIASEVFGT